MSGRVLAFCADMDKSSHWAVKAFEGQPGKKIIDAMMDNARKRECNAKLLESIENAISERLGSSDDLAVLAKKRRCV